MKAIIAAAGVRDADRITWIDVGQQATCADDIAVAVDARRYGPEAPASFTVTG